MAEIVFESDNITKEVQDGAEIAFVAESVNASLPFYCYEGLCETCRILIVEGKENLFPANDKEWQTLGNDKVLKGYRLGCQVKIKSGRVVIKNGWDDE